MTMRRVLVDAALEPDLREAVVARRVARAEAAAARRTADRARGVEPSSDDSDDSDSDDDDGAMLRGGAGAAALICLQTPPPSSHPESTPACALRHGGHDRGLAADSVVLHDPRGSGTGRGAGGDSTR